MTTSPQFLPTVQEITVKDRTIVTGHPVMEVPLAEIKTKELPASRTTASGELNQQSYNEASVGYDWVLRNDSIA